MPQMDINKVTNPDAPVWNSATGGAYNSPGHPRKKDIKMIAKENRFKNLSGKLIKKMNPAAK